MGAFMPSAEHEQIQDMMRNLMGQGMASASSPADGPNPDGQIMIRNMFESTAQPVSAFPNVTITEVDADGVSAEWVVPKSGNADTGRRLLYIHGGAFFMGSPRTHRPITTHLAEGMNAAVLAIDYRMIPDNVRQDGIDDCETAWRWMAENGPEGPSTARRMMVAGDSAGGNLTLSLLLALKQDGERQADAATAIAPLTDATMQSESLIANAPTDALLGQMIGTLEAIPVEERGAVQAETWGIPADHPSVSPIHGDLDNLPPILVHASTTECLFDDARRFTEKAQAAGTDVTLQTRDGLMHVWHNFAPNVPESVDALAEISAFFNDKAG